MSYTDLRDFEAEATFDLGHGILIQIEKLGGGTLGKRYDGTWRYIVSVSDEYRDVEIMRGQELATRLPYTHAEAAADIADWLASGELRNEWERDFGDTNADLLAEFAHWNKWRW